MVASVTTQIIWLDHDQNVWDDPEGNPLFYTTTPVDDVYADKLYPKYVDPVGYYDRQDGHIMTSTGHWQSPNPIPTLLNGTILRGTLPRQTIRHILL
ncbi:MAG: hypothetical protein U5L72_16400 [Bacteroidales bacterium]|nr:hypothetical protein [Bacteroidales bacterium]